MKVGDVVTRVLGGVSDEGYVVTRITPLRITVTNPRYGNAEWKFDHQGREIDARLGWGPQKNGSFKTGSYIVIPGVEPPKLLSPKEIVAAKILYIMEDRECGSD